MEFTVPKEYHMEKPGFCRKTYIRSLGVAREQKDVTSKMVPS